VSSSSHKSPPPLNQFGNAYKWLFGPRTSTHVPSVSTSQTPSATAELPIVIQKNPQR
jgi:hypothetical protein